MAQEPKYKFYSYIENDPKIIQETIENIVYLGEKHDTFNYDLVAIVPSQSFKTVTLVWQKSKDQ